MRPSGRNAEIYLAVAGAAGARVFRRPRSQTRFAKISCLTPDMIGDTLIPERELISYASVDSPVDRDGAVREARFYHALARQVDDCLKAEPDADLILCAPAHQLCLLRDYISNRTRPAIVCEIAADLSESDIAEIERRIAYLDDASSEVSGKV